MKNFIKLFGIIAIVAIIGFSVVGCGEDVLLPGNMGGVITATKGSQGVVELSWEAPPVEEGISSPADGYYVYRFFSTGGISDYVSTEKVRIATTSSTSYTDNSATVPAEFTSKTSVAANYKVYPYNSAGESASYSTRSVGIKPW